MNEPTMILTLRYLNLKISCKKNDILSRNAVKLQIQKKVPRIQEIQENSRKKPERLKKFNT